MKTARNLDIAIVVSGDGDFAPAIRAVQEMGVRVEVISFRGNTSSDLIEVADIFTDITQLARVEKGSSRSGRRVAGDDEDLSMTEVPDKQTEGTGVGRGPWPRPWPGPARRGRAGGRAWPCGNRTARATLPPPARASTALPGEKLSQGRSGGRGRAQSRSTTRTSPSNRSRAGTTWAIDAEGRRRRRRRGGRGRGRGRGRELEAGVGAGCRRASPKRLMP